MRAADIFDGVEYSLLGGSLACCVTDIVSDSRRVTEGAVFVCRRGARADGHSYIDDAIKRGAAGLVLTGDEESNENWRRHAGGDVFAVRLKERSVGRLCNNFWGFPSKRLVVVGVTGTKGKTTVVCAIRRILELWGRRAGMIGTIGIYDRARHIASENTTPDVTDVHRAIAQMVGNGAEYCVMEVSSQGLMKGRVAGVAFDIGVCTNLSADHIGANEHRTFEEYERWKESLFDCCKLAVINMDDIYAPCFERAAAMSALPVFGYGMRRQGCIDGSLCVRSYTADEVHPVLLRGMMGAGYRLSENGGLAGHVRYVTVGMPGAFNVYNSLAALGVCDVLGVPREIIWRGLSEMSAEGRLESVSVSESFRVFIDYAHNAVSLKNVLTTIRAYHPGRIICLFGCGGGRAKARRTQMGRVSGELADITVITSDNPRDEPLEQIMSDIEAGVLAAGGIYVKAADRKEAIRYALTTAREGDVVLLAGKGHERYQEVGGVKTHMDERELIREIMEEEDAGAICGCDNRYIP